jgi:hypothetical protein
MGEYFSPKQYSFNRRGPKIAEIKDFALAGERPARAKAFSDFQTG